MRLQTGKIVLKYIENFVRREREAVNRFRDFLSDVVRQSDMVLLSLCTVSTLYGMVLIASATHFRNTFKYVAIQGFGLLLGVLLYFLLSSIDVSEVGKKWKWLLAFNFGFILLLRTPFGLTRNGNRAWLGVNDIGKRLGVGFLENFPITVQPAEIVKITFILLLARQLALLQEKRDLRSFTNVIQPTAHAGAMFVFYYILSKDAGSGLVYLFVFLCMAFAAGFALRWIILGIGGAVVRDGEVVMGSHGFAGEIGHLSVAMDGPLCSCGRHGCLEAFAGRRALVEAAGIAEDGDATSSEAIDMFLQRWRAGDSDVAKVVDQAADALVSAIASAVNLVDVDTVLLGGLWTHFGDELATVLEGRLRSEILGYPNVKIRVFVPPVALHPSLYGAAEMGLRRFIENPLGYMGEK